MKKTNKASSRYAPSIGVALAAIALAGCAGEGPGANEHASHHHNHATGSPAAPSSSEDTKYQCSMHPNIVSDKEGKCPICGMDLQVAQSLDHHSIPGRSSVQLNEHQEQLINLRTTQVERRIAKKFIEVQGLIQHDPSNVYTISAWTTGRIERLVVNQEETKVQKGDPLFEIYSPEIYSALQDYLNLKKSSVSNDALLSSAEFRFGQMGLQASQLKEIVESGQAPRLVEIRSPASGTVMEKNIHEGQYIGEGDALYTVVDLSDLWLIVDLFESDLPFVTPGQRVTATTPAIPGVVFQGALELVNHHVDANTRAAKGRIVLEDTLSNGSSQGENPHSHGLLPDLWMSVNIEKDLGPQLVIPRASLFDSGRRQYVFVETEKGIYSPREVSPGPTIGNEVVIYAGLEETERVVTDGLFLLDSESLLAAASSDNHDTAPAAVASGIPPSALSMIDQFWIRYHALSDALETDQVAPAQALLQGIRSDAMTLQSPENLPKESAELYRRQLKAIERLSSEPADFSSIAEARRFFGQLSGAIIDWTRIAPETIRTDLVIASCPMWTDSPNQWIQAGESLENPFMGASMLQCGAIDERLDALNAR